MTTRICIPFMILCGTWVAQAAVNCNETRSGRFADPADDKCKNYTICIYVKDTDTFIMFNTVCPKTHTVFDPDTSKCTTPDKYDCSKRTHLAIIHDQIKICSYDGYIADPDITNCTTYIQCVNVSGAFTQIRHTCPATTYYNPNTSLCDPFYKCKHRFSCISAGRFANIFDPSCRTYYFCVPMKNGTFATSEFVCPVDTMFHALTKLCTMDYHCH